MARDCAPFIARSHQEINRQQGDMAMLNADKDQLIVSTKPHATTLCATPQRSIIQPAGKCQRAAAGSGTARSCAIRQRIPHPRISASASVAQQDVINHQSHKVGDPQHQVPGSQAGKQLRHAAFFDATSFSVRKKFLTLSSVAGEPLAMRADP